MMRRYAEHTGCRRSFLLTYLGQDYAGPCGNCDNDPGAAEADRADVPFAVGTRVVSGRWGQGTMQRYDGDEVTVLFDDGPGRVAANRDRAAPGARAQPGALLNRRHQAARTR